MAGVVRPQVGDQETQSRTRFSLVRGHPKTHHTHVVREMEINTVAQAPSRAWHKLMHGGRGRLPCESARGSHPCITGILGKVLAGVCNKIMALPVCLAKIHSLWW